MTRISKGSMTLVLLVPFLLGATAPDKRSSANDLTVQSEAAKTSSSVPRAPIPTTQPPAPASRSAVAVVSTPAAAPGATAYSIGWSSINGGGAIGTSSPSYRLNSSVGQSAAGAAASTNYNVGLGFWYGAGGCNCPSQGDLAQNGFIDVSDVLMVIQIAFVNGADTQDPGCPKTRGDVNNSGVVDVNDVLYIIKTAFTNGPPPIDPCL